MPAMGTRRFIILFTALFALRLTFGLCEAKWWERDELQTYLIGLKCYTTGTWPYFGPDVNGAENESFNSQIPGALEGLMIGLPFHILPIPEAPFIFLNLLSTSGAALLAWYIRKRIPNLSFSWLFIWISITPWSLYEGTHIINPAFDFLPSILFFIGFMETIPSFSMKWLSPFWSNAFMGFSLFWIMQFHFSYIYLVPLAAFSLFTQVIKGSTVAFYRKNTKAQKKHHIKPWTASWFLALCSPLKKFFLASWRLGGESSKNKENWNPVLYFMAGAAPMAALILPTFMKYGLGSGDVASGFEVPFNWHNVAESFTILARYFSLVCFELPRFIGENTTTRIAFLVDHWWLFLPGVLLLAGGIIQPFVMLFSWFKKDHPIPGWEPLKRMILGVYLMIAVSFWFTNKSPLSHIYLVFYPLLMLYSCYCWSLFAGGPRWRMTAKLFLVLGIYFQVGFSLAVARKDSLYMYREPVARALQEKNYHLVGERRPQSLY
jgi:hypothetical protein